MPAASEAKEVDGGTTHLPVGNFTSSYFQLVWRVCSTGKEKHAEVRKVKRVVLVSSSEGHSKIKLKKEVTKSI